MPDSEQLERHRVAVVVFVETDGVDLGDAQSIAEAAVRSSLLRQADRVPAPDGQHNLTLSFTDRHQRTFTVGLHAIREVGSAWLEPTSKAYPRDDEPEGGH